MINRATLPILVVLAAFLAGVLVPAGSPAGAATPPPVPFEAEGADVVGVARVASDSTASGGAYVEFGRTNPTPGITVSGNRLHRNGHPWVPRGFTLIGALSPTNTGTAGTANQHLNDKEMLAAKSWGADAVRFQVSQPGLDPQDDLYSTAYVERVRQAVALARSHGFAVILSIQDQGLGGGTRHPQPSPATIRDWQTLTPMFNGDLEVMYEIFNEPQNKDDAAGWAVWRNGGPAEDNQGVPAVGHQAVLDAIRASGSHNVVLADGARYAQSLKDVPVLKDPAGRLAYAVHPYLDYISRYPSSWEPNFGYLTATAPVVATEWNVYSWSSFCHPEWPQNAPLLLDFLRDHGIGLFGWAFDFLNSLILDWEYRPTTLVGFDCGDPDKGAGELIQQRYQQAGVVPVGCPSLPANEGEVTATVEVAATGTYRVWSRVRAPDAAHDTYWLQVDGRCPVVVGDGEAVAGAWTWVGGSAGVPLRVDLAAGRHTLRMIGKDAGLDLDRVLLSADGCVPDGTGDACAAPPPPPPPPPPGPTPVTGTFTAAADARVEEAHSTTNYGRSSSLRVDGGGSPDVESYLRFVVSGASGTVQRATMRLYVSSGTAVRPAVHSTSSSWVESGTGGITWRTRPGRTSANLDPRVGKVSSGTWLEYDVTAAVNGNGGVSFVLATTSSDGMTTYSRERSSKRPQLVVTSWG